ncbi:hypothetical protein FRC12_000406 [Ceratobasidium sp. 428]|nr:hypothetical protein FRC12_000406 [Ceratobasidium sp. 428]
MSQSEYRPLLGTTNGHPHHTSLIRNVLNVIFSTGEPGWIASTKFLLSSSRINILLIFVPLSLVASRTAWSEGLIFVSSFMAITSLSSLLGEAVEQLTMSLNPASGALLNVLFGNAVEIIIGMTALLRGELKLIQAFLLGSILSNLLLMFGMCSIAGGLRYSEMNFQVTANQTGASLMTLACIALIIPAAYHSTQKHISNFFSVRAAISYDDGQSQEDLLFVSHSTAIILLVVYILYLVFQLKTHAHLYAADWDGEEDEEVEPSMSTISACAWLSITTVVAAFCAKILVGSVKQTANKYHISEAFIGLIILPIATNTAEHIKSIQMAIRGKFEDSLSVSIGSSIQITALVVPLLVVVSWVTGSKLTLYFTEFETILLFVSIILFNLHVMDGKSNYMKGLMMCALYIIIAIARELPFFTLPAVSHLISF